MVWVLRKWVRVRVAVNVFAMKGVADGSVAVTVAVLEMVGVRVTVRVRVNVGVVDLVRVFDGTKPGMVAVPVAANGVFDRTLVGDLVAVSVRVNVVVTVGDGQFPGVAQAVAVNVGATLSGLVLL